MAYLYLLLAIAAEVVGTLSLKATDGFTRPWPALLTVTGYGLAFYFLAIVLKSMPVAVAYAIWSGLGIVLIAVFAWIAYGERMDIPGAIGTAMIIGGIVVLNLFSKSAMH